MDYLNIIFILLVVITIILSVIMLFNVYASHKYNSYDRSQTIGLIIPIISVIIGILSLLISRNIIVNTDINENGPYYGIWIYASDYSEEAIEEEMKAIEYGFIAQVFYSTEWENLKNERCFIVFAGVYADEESAQRELPKVQTYYSNAYIKCLGAYKK